MKILIPVDGSENANHAVDYVIAIAEQMKAVPQIALLNVQWKIAAGHVKLFIDQDTISDYYREQGAEAMTEARRKLDAAGLAYDYRISIGSPAETIAQVAQEQHADQIVMGAQGQGKLSAFFLGSVVNRVMNLAQVPVVVVK